MTTEIYKLKLNYQFAPSKHLEQNYLTFYDESNSIYYIYIRDQEIKVKMTYSGSSINNSLHLLPRSLCLLVVHSKPQRSGGLDSRAIEIPRTSSIVFNIDSDWPILYFLDFNK